MAALFGVEAWKASGGVARVVLTALAVIFALSGLLLKFLADAIPKAGQVIADTFSQPVAWFVIMIAIFLVLRPFWTTPPNAKAENEAVKIRSLGKRAGQISDYITRYRDTRRLYRGRLSPIEPMVMNGISLLMSLEKQGITVPKLNAANPYAAAVGMELFFRVISPLIRDGHVKEMIEASHDLATQADQVCSSYSSERFWTANEW